MRFLGADHEGRARLVFGLLLASLGALVVRAGYIQLVRGEEYADRARRTQFKEIAIQAPRGRLLDRYGRPLAASYHSLSLAADPQEVEDVAAFATQVAFLLGEPAAAPRLAGQIAAKRERGKRFVYLGKRVDRQTAQRALGTGLAGLFVREEPRREHPHGGAAAALLGMVGADENGRIVGLSGLERRFDGVLGGRDGSCSVLVSGRREQLHLFPECERQARPGSDVRTTLDLVIQQIAEDALDGLLEAHAPRSACALVVDPRNGEILAMAGRPGLDPAAFPHVDPTDLRVPAVQDSYEPGSTLKPLILARALTRGAVRPGQLVDCGPGHMRFGGRTLRDVRPHGALLLADVLVKSSNIGMAQVGQALGVDETCTYLHELGFGRPTGIEVEGEQAGKITPRPDWHPNYTLVSVSMGHEVAVTPVQLVAAYGALLNGGLLFRPTLVRHETAAGPRRIDLSPAATAFVRAAMERVVNDPEGTGRRARLEDVRVGGKTGTSEKYPEGSGKYVSSFIGFAPVEDPRLLVLVVADEPRARDGLRPYGGVVAAPIVGEILRRSLPIVLSPALPESGVRHVFNNKQSQGKVRVAAVHRSSVWAGEGVSPAVSRTSDSGSAEGAVDGSCRSRGR